MRTDFAITAKQVKDIFPGSKLKPRGDTVFRGLRREDVASVCAIDERLNERTLRSSLEDGNETVFLVAVSKNVVIGHTWISAQARGEFTVERVLVRKECEDRGIGTGLVLAFFCFAVRSKAGSVKFFSPTRELNSILVLLGIKQPKKGVLLSEAVEQLRERGLVDLSRQ